MTIQQSVEKREIERLYHFTHSDNLSSILTNGLIPRSTLNTNDLEFTYNDDIRYDGHSEATCLSISFPNAKMFFKCRNQKEGDWVLLELSPSILWEKDCAFYPTNAASNNVRHNDVNFMKTSQSFDFIFSEEIFATNRDVGLPSKYPTDVQAEVLVFDSIEKDYIYRTIHPNKESAEKFKGLFPETAQDYYANLNGRTLYSQRHYYLG